MLHGLAWTEFNSLVLAINTIRQRSLHSTFLKAENGQKIQPTKKIFCQVTKLNWASENARTGTKEWRRLPAQGHEGQKRMFFLLFSSNWNMWFFFLHDHRFPEFRVEVRIFEQNK